MTSLSYAGSWLQAKLQYYQLIAGKKYLAQMSLLRPETYFIENHATSPDKLLTVNLPEMGIDNIEMKVVSIKPYPGIAIKESGVIGYKQIDEIDWANKANRPVTATFARYAEEVYTYKFKNVKTGAVTSINSTPNHPFYVVNKGDYIAISKVSANDELLSQTGEKVKLMCDKAHDNCGIRYNKDNKPMQVYNFEVYQQHRYFVGGFNNVLVHNICDGVEEGPVNLTSDARREWSILEKNTSVNQHIFNVHNQVVYRGDNRTPEIIFRDGFHQRVLTNHGVMNHLYKTSNGEYPYAISTSGDYRVGSNYGRYVYQISLKAKQGISVPNAYRSLPWEVRTHQEIVVTGHISPSQIVGVGEVKELGWFRHTFLKTDPSWIRLGSSRDYIKPVPGFPMINVNQ